jgi:hypothetical protein
MISFAELQTFVVRVEAYLGHDGPRIVAVQAQDNTIPVAVTVHEGRYGSAPVTVDPDAHPEVKLSDGTSIPYAEDWTPVDIHVQPAGADATGSTL